MIGGNLHDSQAAPWRAPRLEQWARMCYDGVQGMYIFTGNALDEVGSRQEWISAALRVYEVCSRTFPMRGDQDERLQSNVHSEMRAMPSIGSSALLLLMSASTMHERGHQLVFCATWWWCVCGVGRPSSPWTLTRPSWSSPSSSYGLAYWNVEQSQRQSMTCTR